jgi:hypothetical protein
MFLPFPETTTDPETQRNSSSFFYSKGTRHNENTLKTAGIRDPSTCRYSVRRERGSNGARPFAATKGTGSHCDVFLCCKKKRNCFFEFHNENYFAAAGLSDEPIYSSTDDGSGEDEDPWILRSLSLPSEDPKEGRVGYLIDQEYREGNVGDVV